MEAATLEQSDWSQGGPLSDAQLRCKLIQHLFRLIVTKLIFLFARLATRCRQQSLQRGDDPRAPPQPRAKGPDRCAEVTLWPVLELGEAADRLLVWIQGGKR